jgi:hypothetical protein
MLDRNRQLRNLEITGERPETTCFSTSTSSRLRPGEPRDDTTKTCTNNCRGELQTEAREPLIKLSIFPSAANGRNDFATLTTRLKAVPLQDPDLNHGSSQMAGTRGTTCAQRLVIRNLDELAARGTFTAPSTLPYRLSCREHSSGCHVPGIRNDWRRQRLTSGRRVLSR